MLSQPDLFSQPPSPDTPTYKSAGILMHRLSPGGLEVLLARPGGPYYRNKTIGFWTIPKGELDPGEEPRTAALREFMEETGYELPSDTKLLPLGEYRNSKGLIAVWHCTGNLPAEHVCASNTFEMVWPPNNKTGAMQTFPEIEELRFFPLDEAMLMITKSQQVLIQRLRDWERRTP